MNDRLPHAWMSSWFIVVVCSERAIILMLMSMCYGTYVRKVWKYLPRYSWDGWEVR
jgi:hypothetical protein